MLWAIALIQNGQCSLEHGQQRYWIHLQSRVDAFLRFNDAEVLQDKGKVTAAIAKEFAESEFEKYRVIQDSLYESDFDKLMNDMEKDDAIH